MRVREKKCRDVRAWVKRRAGTCVSGLRGEGTCVSGLRGEGTCVSGLRGEGTCDGENGGLKR